ncbi:hypothetical protein [Vibrio crassostreae]|uniref:hypothetical protein n=1 Tax=Vibrio crassostreae TaxID=246167 RepID=UPI001B310518|nr:hypothetical protein [Vibrio crassostreae]
MDILELDKLSTQANKESVMLNLPDSELKVLQDGAQRCLAYATKDNKANRAYLFINVITLLVSVVVIYINGTKLLALQDPLASQAIEGGRITKLLVLFLIGVVAATTSSTLSLRYIKRIKRFNKEIANFKFVAGFEKVKIPKV